MRVVTWNAQGGLGSRRPDQRKVDHLRSFDADLALIQEFGVSDPNRDCFPGETKHIFRTTSRGDVRSGLLISCSKGKLTEDKHDKNAAYLACMWEFDGQPIRVVVIHAQGRTYCKHTIQSLDRLRRWLSSGPAIVAGDLNAADGLTAGDNANKDSFQQLWQAIGHAGLGSAWHLSRDRSSRRDDPPTLCKRPPEQCKMIDYVLVSRNLWRVESCDVHPLAVSDHRAVSATLRLELSGRC